ncbi:nitrogenase iron-molybdenum cofactor biosynthesis protein NifN [Paenibacillus sp. 7124]|uniref:Nitrogenase iron-molybdenum cofactor biosynthesis protein NifN n=1 Tax=Paenibacillus apii TaxID=1850370 RepID=A0A6M1PSC8_9BACL|nr:nitrogenase component 1 [Paenibacillus apii]NGM84643.1 nitrogenase iron-molybdenum cofactor biosynthesis protein NifN [Paenibacillus apii]NJJ41260.1 nitrogenase iron-molybdenum cofactor biosynthesis protein NifN [Paenibacillus apii]
MSIPFRSGDESLPGNLLLGNQTTGGVLALQGIYRSLPLLHGGSGCAEAIRTVMSRHFREPVSIQNISIQDADVILGVNNAVCEALRHAISGDNPDVIAIIGTSLTVAAREDLEGITRRYLDENLQAFEDKLLLTLSLPDDEGSMESGYAQVVQAVIEEILRSRPKALPKKHRNRINLLPGPHLTPGDVMELKEIIASFGMEVIVLPDLSSSLTGHLLTGHTALSRGGVPLDYLKEMLGSGFTVAVGRCMEPSAKLLRKELNIPYRVFQGITGLQETDDFFQFLLELSGNEVQVKYRWQRQFLLDCMLDTCSTFRGKRIVAALEADHLRSLSQWLSEVGVKSFEPVVSSPLSAQIHDRRILEQEPAQAADLWVGSSYSESMAEERGIPFIPFGFPVFNRFGSSFQVSVGYRGTAELLNYFGNVLMNGREIFR